jgi:hypothetical protein
MRPKARLGQRVTVNRMTWTSGIARNHLKKTAISKHANVPLVRAAMKTRFEARSPSPGAAMWVDLWVQRRKQQIPQQYQ